MTNAILKITMLSVLFIPNLGGADTVPELYEQENFYNSYQDSPVSFSRDMYGNFSGFTKTGKLFSQVKVVSSISVRLQKFSIDRISFYVSDVGIINAQTDTQALSIYLSHHKLQVSSFNSV